MDKQELRNMRTSEFWWGPDEVYPSRTAVHLTYGDDPIKYIVALGSKDKETAFSELRDIVDSWRCTCQHDCCAHRFAQYGELRRIHGKTYAIIRTDINV